MVGGGGGGLQRDIIGVYAGAVLLTPFIGPSLSGWVCAAKVSMRHQLLQLLFAIRHLGPPTSPFRCTPSTPQAWATPAAPRQSSAP